MKLSAFFYACLYRLFDVSERTLKRISKLSFKLGDACFSGYFWSRQRHWWTIAPSHVKRGELDLPNYCCPFCHADLDYRINFDGILCGVCWNCKKAWLETWDNTDCPSWDNTNWPMLTNVLTDPPSPFWDSGLGHFFMVENGLSIDQGKAQPINFKVDDL